MAALHSIKHRLESASKLRISELELYVLSNVLFWQLSFPTPYDFVASIVRDVMAMSGSGSPSANIKVVLEKTRSVTEFLLLCKPSQHQK